MGWRVGSRCWHRYQVVGSLDGSCVADNMHNMQHDLELFRHCIGDHCTSRLGPPSPRGCSECSQAIVMFLLRCCRLSLILFSTWPSLRVRVRWSFGLGAIPDLRGQLLFDVVATFRSPQQSTEPSTELDCRNNC